MAKPVPCVLPGRAGNMHRDAVFAAQNAHALDMIRVFVGDNDGVNSAGGYLPGCHPAFDFNTRKPRVDEDGGVPVGYVDGIALGAAGQHADPDGVVNNIVARMIDSVDDRFPMTRMIRRL